MTVTTVQTPNGETIQVEHPAGATDAQIISFAQQSYLPKKRTPPIDPDVERRKAISKWSEDLSEFEKFGMGAHQSIRRAAGRIMDTLGIEEDPLTGDTPEQYERDAKLFSYIPGFSAEAGRITPAIAATARVPGGVFSSTAAGAGTGYLTADDAKQGATYGAGGGLLGGLAGNALGRAGNAFMGRYAQHAVQGADDTARSLSQFQNMGGRLTRAQASGSPTSKMLENAATSNFVTSGPYRKIAERNSKLVTQLAARAVGVKSKNLGPTALRSADDVLNKQFNKVADSLEGVPINPALADDITSLLRKGDVAPYADDLAKMNLSGRGYMHLRSKLLRVTRGTSDKVDEAWDTIDDLDEIVEQIAPPNYSRMYAEARERYKTLLAIDKYRRGVSGGEVNARTLEGAVERVFGKQYTRDLPTRLPETKRLFTALRAMSDPRMASHLGGSPTAERLTPLMIAGGTTLSPELAALAAAGYLGSRAAAGQAAPLASQLGGLTGRTIGANYE